MEQDQFQIYDEGASYKPVAQPNLLPAIDREQGRQRQADQDFLEAVRRNNRQRVENAKQAGQDLIALKVQQDPCRCFSRTARREKRRRSCRRFGGRLPGLPRRWPRHDQNNQGMSIAKSQDAVASEVEADVQANSGANYEASARIGKATTWKEVGRRRGFAMGAVSGYQGFVDQQLSGRSFGSSAEYSAALSQVRQQFFKQAGLTGLNPQFLVDSV